MITFISGLVSAFIFLLVVFGVSWSGHSLTALGLAFAAVAIAFIGVVPWSWNRRVQ